jgi:hypothetical protein
MGVSEVVVVFEPVPEGSVQANVTEPDKAERHDERLALPPPDRNSNCWELAVSVSP